MATFETLCNKILGEMVTGTAPSTTSPTPPVGGVKPTVAPTSNNQQKPPQGDEELMQVLQQKLQDEKFKQQLMQMLKQPQQNTGNASPTA